MHPADASPARLPAERSQDLLSGSGWRIPFWPLVFSGDLQTVLARYWPRTVDERRFPTESWLLETEPGTRVLARVSSQPGGEDLPDEQRPTIIAVHGLTACHGSTYMVSSAETGLRHGFDVVRLNVRNCGGTENLTSTLYHSGLTADLRRAVERLAPRPVYVLGYSMGGNMALKLAGEWGDDPLGNLRGVCAISAPIQLDACSRNIGRRRNFLYERHLLRRLRSTLRRKRALMPEACPDASFDRVGSIWEFDERITAPAFGFRDAQDYYRQSSASSFLERIRVPTLVIQARDDPFVPFDAFEAPVFEQSPWLALLAPQFGGHVAFLSKGRPRFWATEQAVHYFAALQRSAAGLACTA